MSPNHQCEIVAALIGGCNMQTGPWIAGSAALACEAFLATGPKPTDVDVFFASQDQLDRALARLAECGASGGATSGCDSEESNDEPDDELGNAYVFYIGGIRINLAGLAFWPTVGALLASFDFSVSQAATDGKPSTMPTLGTHTYADAHNMTLRILKETSTNRVIKYLAKGYKLPDGEVFDPSDSPGRWRSDFTIADAIRSGRAESAKVTP